MLFYVRHTAFNEREKMKAIVLKYENIYAFLALILILSRVIFKDMWISDQLIIYNFLSILMIVAIVEFMFSGKASFIKFIPLFIIVYVFLNPVVLEILFFSSHFFILLIVLWFLFKPGSRNLLDGRINTAVIPLELMILVFFL
jgi:hypothetical protein